MVMDKFRKEYFATVSMVLIAIDSSASDLPCFSWIATHKPFEATKYFEKEHIFSIIKYICWALALLKNFTR